MSDRGDYRAFYCAFWDDADVHALSDRAYRVLTTLKGTLPPSGIGVVYLSQLAERCQCTAPQLEAALVELETPKPGRAVGWIQRERTTIWVIAGLRYEPSMNANNSKHRTYLRRLLAPLGPTAAIVRAFVSQYPEWFCDADSPFRDTSTNGHARPIEGVSKQLASNKPNHSPNLSPALAVTSSQGHPDADSGDRRPLAADGLPDDREYALRLSMAANTAITERWGEQLPPIFANAAKSLEAGRDIRAHGVPLADAYDLVYSIAKQSAARPPKALTYFTAAVCERWDAMQAHRAAASAPKPQLVAPVPSGGRANGAGQPDDVDRALAEYAARDNAAAGGSR